jgi:hypothetical protein
MLLFLDHYGGEAAAVIEKKSILGGTTALQTSLETPTA